LEIVAREARDIHLVHVEPIVQLTSDGLFDKVVRPTRFTLSSLESQVTYLLKEAGDVVQVAAEVRFAHPSGQITFNHEKFLIPFKMESFVVHIDLEYFKRNRTLRAKNLTFSCSKLNIEQRLINYIFPVRRETVNGIIKNSEPGLLQTINGVLRRLSFVKFYQDKVVISAKNLLVRPLRDRPLVD